MKLKDFSWRLAFVSLILGLFVTYLFTGQVGFRSQGDCSNAQIRTAVTSKIRRVDCAGRTYGFPYKFISTTSQLSVVGLTEAPSDEIMLGVSSAIKFDMKKALANVLVWSLVSFVALLVVGNSIRPRKQKENLTEQN